MTKTRTPNIESAAVTARVISRMLRKAGFLMADTRDRYRWTEGYHVSRIGYGRDVSVDYHVPSYHSYNPADRDRAREARSKVFAFLVAKGYVFVRPGYIECDHD